MVKIESIEFPDLKLDEAIQITSKLKSKFQGKVDSKNMDVFAQSVGHKSSKNGAFIVKIGDLRKYGLIEPRNPIQITSLGEKIVYPNNAQEKQAAIIEAIQNVAFFKKLLEITNGSPPDNEFHITLQQVGMSREASIKNNQKLQKIYNNILPYISKDSLQIKQDVVMENKSVSVVGDSPLNTQNSLQSSPVYDLSKEKFAVFKDGASVFNYDISKKKDVKALFHYLKEYYQEEFGEELKN